MTMFRLFSKGLVVAAMIVLTSGVVWAAVVDEARVTIECRNHAVTVSMVEFWLDDTLKYQDNNPGLVCTIGNGDTKLYTFGAPMDLNAFEFWYACDGGPATMMHIPPAIFYFHIPIKLPCPSQGGVIAMDTMSAPTADDAMLIVSDHDVLMWPSSECFKFKGGRYDYVCVTWYCESAFEPVFQITPGCSDPCGDPNCTPALYSSVAWSAPCNPVPNIWCRMFWPVGLTRAGCWCYNFEFQLPVELASFTAVPAAGTVQLRFATASELNNGYFEIWRGTQANGTFAKIAQIESYGNSTTEQVYTHTDNNVSSGVTYFYYLADVDIDGHRVDHRDRMIEATPISSAASPESYSLAAYPNPFNPTTTLEFTLPEEARVMIKVYDVAGREVAELVNGSYKAGSHKAVFDAAALPTGIYIARLETGSIITSTKLLLIK
jgi:hypothetical protein